MVTCDMLEIVPSMIDDGIRAIIDAYGIPEVPIVKGVAPTCHRLGGSGRLPSLPLSLILSPILAECGKGAHLYLVSHQWEKGNNRVILQ